MSMDQTPEQKQKLINSALWEAPQNNEATRGEHPEGLEGEQEAAVQQDSTETKPQIEFHDNELESRTMPGDTLMWGTKESLDEIEAAFKEMGEVEHHAMWYGSTPPNEILNNEDGSVTLVYDDHATISRTMTLEEAKMRFPEHFDKPTNKMVNLQEKKRMDDFRKMLTTPDPDLAKKLGDTLYGKSDKTRNVKVWIVGPNAKREWDAALKRAMDEGSRDLSKEDYFPVIAQMVNAANSLQVEGDRKEVTEANLTHILGDLLYGVNTDMQRVMFEIFFANLKEEDQQMFDAKLGHIEEYANWRKPPDKSVWMPYSHYLVEQWFHAGSPGFDRSLHSTKYPNE